MAEDETSAAQQDIEAKTIQPQKVYLKDVSFETPNSPRIFTRKWEPGIEVEFRTSAHELETDLYEIVVTLTVTTAVDGQTAYLAEVHQAGIFVMKGFDPEDLHMKQNVYCVRILYPYASAAVADLVTRGGFPQLVLSPLNFEMIYRDRVKRKMEPAPDKSDQAEPQQA
ncbi:MAG TPA: protein-export chaperone SecB [Gammaproteobacteria bacterium]|nr:protein-export chaperone SecB [Gammaproteobacteria bacterium]